MVGGWCSRGTHRSETIRPRDTSSKARDTSSKRHIVQETHRPRDTSSKGKLSMGHIVQGNIRGWGHVGRGHIVMTTFPWQKYFTFKFFSSSRKYLKLHKSQKSCNLQCTAKKKCQKFEANIPRKGISGPESQFPHSCVRERTTVYIPTSCRFCWRRNVDR